MKKLVERLVLRDVWLLQIFKAEGIRLDERWDGFDGLRPIVYPALLEPASHLRITTLCGTPFTHSDGEVPQYLRDSTIV